MQGPLSRYRIYGGTLNYRETLREMLLGTWRRGESVRALEERARQDFDVPFAAAAPMARTAIYLAVKNAIRPGQDVLMSPYTIADVVNVVIAAGGRPRFVDVEPGTCNMDPDELRRRLAPGCGAILATHLHGVAARIDEIAAVAQEAGLPLIEDAAQALGGRASGAPDGRRLGSIGDYGVFSFGAYKNVNAWYGGLLLSNDRAAGERIRAEIDSWPDFPSALAREKMRKSAVIDALGWEPVFRPFMSRVIRFGELRDVEAIKRAVSIELDLSRRDWLPDWYRTRLTAGQARRVLAQWDAIDDHARQRVAKARLYHEALASLAESDGFVRPPGPDGLRHVYTYYPLQARNRANVLKWLMFFRRDVAPQHLKNCAGLPAFREFAHDCPEARRTAESVVLLPTYPSYDDEEVLRNCAVLRWYVESGRPEFSRRPTAKLLTERDLRVAASEARAPALAGRPSAAST